MSDVLAELEALVRGMSPADKKELDKHIAKELAKDWLPEPDNEPQTEAYFSHADLLLYGGAAGGGKTDLLLGLALTEHEKSVIFRRAFVDLRGAEERLIEIIGTRDGYNGQDRLLRRGKRVIELGALEKPGAEFSWQGRPHDFIGFDEGAQLSAEKVRFVLGWLRSAKPGQRKRAVIASNPPLGGEGDWLIEWFAPWLDPLHINPALPGELRWGVISAAKDAPTIWVDGPESIVLLENGGWRLATEQEVAEEEEREDVLRPLSRTFIPAKLKDNPHLRGTGYRAQIQAMPEPIRTKLLEGDFLAGREDHEWQVIPTEWIVLAQERWTAQGQRKGPMHTIGVDVAQGGPDNTTLAPFYGVRCDRVESHKGIDTKDGPVVAALVMKTLRDGALPVIDMTGGWGGSARDHLQGQDVQCMSIVFSAASGGRSKGGDYVFANLRSELWWRFREALDPTANRPDEMPTLPPDRQLQAEMTAPRWHLKGNRLYIESKDEIRSRLGGASTDKGDAVILGWHGRPRAALRMMRKKGPRPLAVPSDPLAMWR